MYIYDLFIFASMSSNILNLNNGQDSDRYPTTSPGGDFSGADLSDGNLSEHDYSYADLSGADLSDAFCLFTNFSYANLDGANLTSAYLAMAILNNASLKNVQLNVETLESTGVSSWSTVRTLEGANVSGSYDELT